MTDHSPDPAHRTIQAFVGLGSNLSDSVALVRAAMDRLDSLSVSPLLRSSLWRTTPVDCPPDSPNFINAVAALEPLPDETPESLLDKLQALETAFGRRPRLVVNEPRRLDLDLIAFGEEQRRSDRLRLPHPRAHLRRFVLAPLAELAPGWVLPGRSETVRELLDSLGTTEVIERLSG